MVLEWTLGITLKGNRAGGSRTMMGGKYPTRGSSVNAYLIDKFSRHLCKQIQRIMEKDSFDPKNGSICSER